MPSNQSLDDGKSVLLYDPTGTHLTIEFCKELQRRINGLYGSQVKVKEVGENLSMPCHLPVMVVCHNHSRIGTDIDSAIASFKDSDQSKPYIVIVVLHAKERHALPITMPTETLYDEKYEQYGLLVDVAFTPENGIYTCDMNTKAIEKLTSFLQLDCGRRDFIDYRGVINSYMYVCTSVCIQLTLEQILFTVFLACVFVVCLTLVVVLIKI